MRALGELLDKAAQSDAKVLITGESGVGKEVAARLVHQKSNRALAPFVTVNCAGLPDSLLESELFGHVRGSFTGAYRDKPGLLELGHGGTAFLDEVGEMSLRMQPLLLRFLENGEIQRVGTERPRPQQLDVRIIAATNRNLAERVAENSFREDLYYRLNVIHLIIPPLRERREEIPGLLRYYLGLYGAQYRVPRPELSAEALGLLEAYQWPGNVRELRNVAERLIVQRPSGPITIADLPREVRGMQPVGDSRERIPVNPPPVVIFERMITGRESFWSAVYAPFMARDLTRTELRHIINSGLDHTRGSYKALVELFNMPPDDYKRFLNFLRKHECHMPFQRFRSLGHATAQPRT